VPGPDPVFLAMPAAFGAVLYGPVPGVEFIPYFLGLLAWAGLAVAAILTAPFAALLRRLRRGRGAPPGAPQPPADGSHDRA
jgi:hypothetical protein